MVCRIMVAQTWKYRKYFQAMQCFQEISALSELIHGTLSKYTCYFWRDYTFCLQISTEIVIFSVTDFSKICWIWMELTHGYLCYLRTMVTLAFKFFLNIVITTFFLVRSFTFVTFVAVFTKHSPYMSLSFVTFSNIAWLKITIDVPVTTVT